MALADPLTITGVFTLGAAAGSLIAYARYRRMINECQEALELSAFNRLSSEKFEAFALDVHDVAACGDIFKRLKETCSNEDLVVFAVAVDSRAKQTASLGESPRRRIPLADYGTEAQ
jgi:hypothetical protein